MMTTTPAHHDNNNRVVIIITLTTVTDNDNIIMIISMITTRIDATDRVNYRTPKVSLRRSPYHLLIFFHLNGFIRMFLFFLP